MKQLLLLLLFIPALALGQTDYDEVKEAAERGDVAAQYRLARGYMFGFLDSGKGNDREAFKWFLQAAQQGHLEAQIEVAYWYEVGRGTPENDTEAVKWYRLAAEQGDANAQLNLGVKLANGEGVPENDAEAVKWFRLAAEQGDSDAQKNLGTMYNNGMGVPENEVRAYVWFSVAAALGNEDARLRRDVFSTGFTREQLAEGQALASKCFDSDFKDCPF